MHSGWDHLSNVTHATRYLWTVDNSSIAD